MIIRIISKSIKIKITLVLLGSMLLASVFSYHFFPLLQKQYMLKDLYSYADVTAKIISDICVAAVSFGDTKGVDRIVTGFRKIEELSCIEITGNDNFTYKYTANEPKTPYHRSRLIVAKYPITHSATSDIIGQVKVSLNTRRLERNFKKFKQYILLCCTALFISGGLFSVIIGNRLTLPIIRLKEAMSEVAKGKREVEITQSSDDEIGVLTNTFVHMLERINESHKKIESHAHNLEERVRERTAELEHRNKELSLAHENILQRENKLKNAQSQLVLNEKMASLGLLISGIAHEINTPSGAIANMAMDLRGKVETITSGLLAINELNKEELNLLGAFSVDFIKGNFVTDNGGRWRKNLEIREWLADLGVENSKYVLVILSKYNLLEKEKLEKYKTLLVKPWVVNFLDSLGTVNIAVQICESSIKKITQIVKALKYYAYTDMDKTSLVDINESIENALVLLHNKLKYSVNIVKDLKSLKKIYCTSEINQVWTNLLSNAHDAILEAGTSKKGEIRIETEEEENLVKVKITDNGVGISKENIGKIFDPFFTTKGIGKGTGLGLSIVSGIVKKHDGKIQVDSTPGNTIITVLLPKGGENGVAR